MNNHFETALLVACLIAGALLLLAVLFDLSNPNQ